MTANEMPPMATPRVAAGALFFDGEGRVLLVRPNYKGHWDIPGGYVEPGESPRAACVREVQEELGLTPTLGPMLVVDWAPAENEGDKLLFIFDGGSLGAEQERDIRFADGELTEWRYVSAEALEQHGPSRLARRIRTAIAARSNGVSAYAEHGSAI
ncbi:NUDIX domain-containing protein [Micromonospora coxensis]|uniref:ADP-ribose pyrophosphatase YjhB, NUDIX family n=1 Tax=Micromonospora coxensis TaxID=356852 RepID=A0A1C5IYN3_9ACTN|nr:NUDIX hydrolase [Micromonospora coxensis]SCG63442.1 ADP-ribose pyrophosphatase YjhB, NUDIX family [Micromonospora coxensis]